MLSHRNAFNFYKGVFRQSRNLNRAAGRGIFSKKLCVYFIHCGKMIHVFEKDSGFNNVLQAEPGSG